ncbi:hypothetical protein IV203_004277 [Nitzschia inconspicua]|uniref:Uncharacterized protein n=1 Tax=Nitzschia inconspicua TaxID=303405 RepID=A0A9K3L4Z3_9STRA|nr:hypothetical protein IV203_004277 [Nitzschia inconspicua]
MNYTYSSGIPSLMLQSHVSRRDSGSTSKHHNHSARKTYFEDPNLGTMSVSDPKTLSYPEESSRPTPPSEYSSAPAPSDTVCDSEETSMSEANEDHDDDVCPDVAVPQSPSRCGNDSNMKASETYLQSSPYWRNKRTIESQSGLATSPAKEDRPSSSSALEYKSKVQQLIQKMEEQQAQHFRDQDAKSLEFRKRIDRLLHYGDGNNNSQSAQDSQEHRKRDSIVDDGSTAKHTNNNDRSPRSDASDFNLGPYDITKTQTHCTASTRSISASSWSLASASKDEEDNIGAVSQVRQSGQPQVVHVPRESVSTSRELIDPSAAAAAAAPSSLETLRKRLAKMEFEKSGLQSENEALRSLRESYKRRFAVEQQERLQLQNQVALLKSYLDDVKTMNRHLQADLDESRTMQRKQRTNHLVTETVWKGKTDRVRRDFDKLWRDHKSSQTDLKESLRSIQDLQDQLDNYRKQERTWNKEKTFLKEKVKYLQGKIKTFQTTMKSVKEENERSM